ncbi:MAG: FHA domain-containing protein [Planctomycetaceae bacterium]
MATLIILSGKHQGKRLSLPEKNVTIGRDEECGLRVASTEVSRQHCVLIPTAEGLLVRDLDSQNGTFINDVPVAGERILAPGDILKVGPMQFQLSGKKPRTEASKGKDDGPPLSDDDIASWLGVGDDSSENIKTSDTTIIPTTSKTAPTPPQTASPPPKRKHFKSIGDEAADIIRRHWESVNNNQAAGPTP